jgi:hypothetical protein
MAVLTQQAVNAMRLSQSAAAVLRMIKGSFSPRLTKAHPFKSVGFGQTAILELDESKTIQHIEVVTNLPFSMIESISFEYQDGSEFSVIKPDVIKARGDFIRRYYEESLGRYRDEVNYQTVTRFTLDFADTSYETTDAIRRGELVVLPGETIRMKVRVKPFVDELSVPDVIELSANFMESPAQADRYFVNRFSEMIIDQNVAGEQTHKFPLMGIPHRIRRMYIINANDLDIEYLEIIRDRVKVYWGDVSDITYSQLYDNKGPWPGAMVEEGGARPLVIDFTQNGYATESAFVPVANESLQLKLRTGSAGPVRIAFEYITQVKDVPTTLQAQA